MSTAPRALQHRRQQHADRAVANLRKAADLPARGSRAEVLHEVALDLFEIRETFIRDDTGLPDWRGSSYPYRVFMRELYASAGLPSGETAIKYAVRHQLDKVVHERVSEDDLAASNLTVASRNKRANRTYHGRSSLADHTATLLRSLALSPFRDDATEEELNVATSAVRDLLTFLKVNNHPAPRARRKPS